MEADEFRAILDRLGASPAAWASLVQTDARLVRGWASGRTAIPAPMAALARVADAVAQRDPRMAAGELAALLRAEAARLDGETTR